MAVPKDVDISLSGGITVEWSDGHKSRYGIKYLRDACPCATCTDAHGTGEAPTKTLGGAPAGVLPIYKPTGATLVSAQPVGRYGLQLFFSDNHNTGIYTWDYLRELCACDECQRLRSKEP